VHHLEYRRALLATLREDAPELIEDLGLGEMLDRLAGRLEDPERHAAVGRLTRGILDEAGARSPMRLSGEQFNRAAESYYRGALRRRHLREGLDLLRDDARALDARPESAAALRGIVGEQTAASFLARHEPAVLAETAGPDALTRLIHLTLLSIRRDARTAGLAGEP
jgi:hypothetical protein